MRVVSIESSASATWMIARAERDLVPAQTVRIAGAVEALVVVPDRRHGVGHEAETVDDPGSLGGVPAHQAPLLGVETRRLHQDRVRDRQLADVVEEGGVAEKVELGTGEVELAADRERQALHAARVAGRVRVARVDRRGEAFHRRGRALAEQPVRLLERHVLRVDRLGRLAQLPARCVRSCARCASCDLRIIRRGRMATASADRPTAS